jgi:hypothetical protein
MYGSGRIEKIKVDMPQEEFMALLDKCDDTLRSPGNEARHIIREHLKTKQTKPNKRIKDIAKTLTRSIAQFLKRK